MRKGLKIFIWALILTPFFAAFCAIHDARELRWPKELCYPDLKITGTPAQCQKLRDYKDAARASGYANNHQPIGAGQLYDAYEENEPRANLNFKGKSIWVNGVVREIDTGTFGDEYLLISVPSEYNFWYIKAELADVHFGDFNELIGPDQKAAELNKGDVVHMICTGAGRVMKNPILRDCILQ